MLPPAKDNCCSLGSAKETFLLKTKLIFLTVSVVENNAAYVSRIQTVYEELERKRERKGVGERKRQIGRQTERQTDRRIGRHRGRGGGGEQEGSDTTRSIFQKNLQ